MKRIEVNIAVSLLVLPDDQSTDDDTWNCAGMEKNVAKLHDQMRAAPTDSVQQDRCKLNSIKFN